MPFTSLWGSILDVRISNCWGRRGDKSLSGTNFIEGGCLGPLSFICSTSPTHYTTKGAKIGAIRSGLCVGASSLPSALRAPVSVHIGLLDNNLEHAIRICEDVGRHDRSLCAGGNSSSPSLVSESGGLEHRARLLPYPDFVMTLSPDGDTHHFTIWATNGGGGPYGANLVQFLGKPLNLVSTSYGSSKEIAKLDAYVSFFSSWSAKSAAAGIACGYPPLNRRVSLIFPWIHCRRYMCSNRALVPPRMQQFHSDPATRFWFPRFSALDDLGASRWEEEWANRMRMEGFSPEDLSTIGGIATVSLLHSFIPTHWLPFSIVGRAQKWNLSRTLLVSTSLSPSSSFQSWVFALVFRASCWRISVLLIPDSRRVRLCLSSLLVDAEALRGQNLFFFFFESIVSSYYSGSSLFSSFWT